VPIPEEQRRKPHLAPSHGLQATAGDEIEPFVEILEPHEDFQVEALSSEGVHRVVLRGELDMLGAPVLWSRIRELCSGPTRGLRLDLRRLTFMDSSGLHVVLDARELCARAGFEFALIGGTPAVRRLFEVSGLGALLRPQQP
jgi:anti-sigma B factor antagonist